MCGSPITEIFNTYQEQILQSESLKKLKIKSKEFFLASFHRQENVDNEETLKKILLSLNTISEEYNKEIVISTHPRTKERLDNLTGIEIDKRLKFLKPFGFFDYLYLQLNAKAVISDSGSISEEAAILNFPAITIRNSMERPEAMDSGSITLAGHEKKVILKSLKLTLDQFKTETGNSIPTEYKIQNTSWRILKLILGTAKLSNKWSGIEELN